MRKLILIFLATLMSLPALAGDVTVKGDDLFPWPWGSECPFPWSNIEGIYQVKASNKNARTYESHYLSFYVSKEGKDGVRFLKIEHYDNEGNLYASGDGYSQKDKRVVRGVLTTRRGRDFVVVIRSYKRDEGRRCSGEDLVTAVAFCPLRGKKCMNDSNYILEKVSDN